MQITILECYSGVRKSSLKDGCLMIISIHCHSSFSQIAVLLKDGGRDFEVSELASLKYHVVYLNMEEMGTIKEFFIS